MLIAIDPGVKTAGVALFTGDELSHARCAMGETFLETVDNIISQLTRANITDLVIEIPQVYTQNKLKGDPNDLIKVGLMVGATCRAFAGVPQRYYRPHQWKGQVPKKIMIGRIKERLSPVEKARVELPKARKAQTDVWDAIGIGLHYLGRRRCVYEGERLSS